jgi:hypothetical protein
MALEAQNNPFTSVLMVEAADPEALPDADPSAGQRRLAVGTDHLLYLVDDSGVKTLVGGAGIANPLATDSLWDAAGDLVQGSGANTAAKLSAGSAGKVLTSNGAAAALTWETPAGGGAMATDALWDAAGDLAQGTGANTGAKLSAGTAGYVLTSQGAAAANVWAANAALAFHGAHAYNAGTQTGAGVRTFGAEVFDTDAYHSTSSNTSRMTIPSTALAGYYLCRGFVPVGTTKIVRILKNGSTVHGSNVVGSNGVETTALLSLANTDYVEVYTDDAGTTGHASAVEAMSTLWIMKVGD